MADVTVRLPEVGTVAYFTFKEPFAKYITNLYNLDTGILKLEVLSITAMRDLVRLSHRDPFTDVYDKAGLGEIEYKQDLHDSIPLVTFMYRDEMDTDRLFRVPLNYIDSINETSSIEYGNRALVINLGQLPIDLDVSFIYSDVVDFIADRLGLTPELRDVTTGEINLLSQEEHDIREEIRGNTTKVRKTLATQLLETENHLQAVLTKLDEMGIVLAD